MLVKDRLQQVELFVHLPRSEHNGWDTIKLKYLSYDIKLMSHIDDFYGGVREDGFETPYLLIKCRERNAFYTLRDVLLSMGYTLMSDSYEFNGLNYYYLLRIDRGEVYIDDSLYNLFSNRKNGLVNYLIESDEKFNIMGIIPNIDVGLFLLYNSSMKNTSF